MKKRAVILISALFATAALAQKEVPGEGKAVPAAKTAAAKIDNKAGKKTVQKKAPVKKTDKKVAAKAQASSANPQAPVKK